MNKRLLLRDLYYEKNKVIMRERNLLKDRKRKVHEQTVIMEKHEDNKRILHMINKKIEKVKNEVLI